MQLLCRSHDWTVVNHYYTQNWGLTVCVFAAMLHSQFVPHIVATMPQNWLGLGHAVFVQKSWFDCGKSLLHTKLGSNRMYFCGNAALTVCAPHCGHCAPKLARSWSCSFCAEVMVRTVVNHYYTQKLGSHRICILRQCCTHSLCPTLWPLCPKTGSVLAMQFLCRSHGWTVVNHYYTQNWGPHRMFFCGNAALTVCAAHCGHYAPKLARSWPCSFCAEVMIGLW